MNRSAILSPRTVNATLALLALAGVTAWRILLLARLPDQGFFAKYLFFADRFLAGEVPASRLPDLSPGYFWAVVVFRGFGLEYPQIRAIQVVLVSIGIAALAWMLWRRSGAFAAIAAAVILFLNRAALLNASELEPESAVFLWISLLIACAAWPGEKGARFAAAAGLAAGLAVITRPSNLLIAIVTAVWIFFEFTPHRRRAVLVYALALAVPIGAAFLANAALTGQWVLMNPGTVFYEGMNPAASGYSAVAPTVVTDLEACLREPDALHVSYRIVAGRSLGTGSAQPRTANHFWTSRAFRWASDFPAAAAKVTARKAAGSIHSFDAWDLSTIERKDRLLGRFGWIPFGFVFLLALTGLVLRPDRLTAFLTALVLCGILVMTVFYVSARQRNALLPPAAVLAGAGAAAISLRFRSGRRGEAIALGGAVLVVGALLTLPSNAARENRYMWSARFDSEELLQRATRAEDEGRSDEARSLRAFATTFNPDLAHPDDAPLLIGLAREMIDAGAPPQRSFDLARAMLNAGLAEEADAILAMLQSLGYVPVRERSGTGSVSLLRARAAIARGDAEAARSFAQQALDESPGDPLALALAAATHPSGMAATQLARLHDPFTIRLAYARIAADAGDRERAARLVESTSGMLPHSSCLESRWRRRLLP
jgi:hypothetical protein